MHLTPQQIRLKCSTTSRIKEQTKIFNLVFFFHILIILNQDNSIFFQVSSPGSILLVGDSQVVGDSTILCNVLFQRYCPRSVWGKMGMNCGCRRCRIIGLASAQFTFPSSFTHLAAWQPRSITNLLAGNGTSDGRYVTVQDQG